jgi:hypothetical protein
MGCAGAGETTLAGKQATVTAPPSTGRTLDNTFVGQLDVLAGQ